MLLASLGGQFIPTTGDCFSTQLTLSVVEQCMRFYVNLTFESVDQTLFNVTIKIAPPWQYIHLGGGALGISGRGCAAGTLKPLTHPVIE